MLEDALWTTLFSDNDIAMILHREKNVDISENVRREIDKQDQEVQNSIQGLLELVI